MTNQADNQVKPEARTESEAFAGSGTTLKAAKELSRRYVGIEINEPYINIIKNRLAQDALSLGV